MSPPNRLDDWIDDDEYPDDRDASDFGDDSPPDDDPLTLGRVPGIRPRFWTPGRLLLALVVLLIVAALLLPSLLPLLR
jgi:hypothetical protein